MTYAGLGHREAVSLSCGQERAIESLWKRDSWSKLVFWMMLWPGIERLNGQAEEAGGMDTTGRLFTIVCFSNSH